MPCRHARATRVFIDMFELFAPFSRDARASIFACHFITHLMLPILRYDFTFMFAICFTPYRCHALFIDAFLLMSHFAPRCRNTAHLISTPAD